MNRSEFGTTSKFKIKFFRWIVERDGVCVPYDGVFTTGDKLMLKREESMVPADKVVEFLNRMPNGTWCHVTRYIYESE